MTDLHQLSAVELAGVIAAKQVSIPEVTRYFVDRATTSDDVAPSRRSQGSTQSPSPNKRSAGWTSGTPAPSAAVRRSDGNQRPRRNARHSHDLRIGALSRLRAGR